MRCALLWDFMQHRMAVPYWSFGATYQFHLPESSSMLLDPWRRNCTSVQNYQFTPCKILKDCRLQSQLLKMYIWPLLNITVFVTLVWKVRVKGAGCGLRGAYPAGVSMPLKHEKCHLLLPSPMHACPCHGPWKRLQMAKPCKGKMRVPDTIIGTNQLRGTTQTEHPRSSKVAGVAHKVSNFVSENLTC